MPQIPVYQTRVREQALEGGLQRAPDVSSGLQSVAKGFGHLAAAAAQIVERDDRAAADAADAEITGAWLQWDAENRAKYRGQNADGYQAEAQGWWRKAAETYGTKLSPRARELVSGTLLRKQTSALADVTRHVGAEKERFAVDSFDAAMKNTMALGVTTGNMVGASDQVRKAVAEFGARRGWDTNMVLAEQKKYLAQGHLAHIAKLIEDPNGGAAAAQAYYQSVKGEVPEANQPRVESMLKNSEDEQFASQFSAERAGKPLEQTLQDASKITDTQRREKVITRVKQDHALVREAQREREEKAADTAWQLFAQGKKIPEAVLSGMDGKGRVQLQEAQRARAERMLAGKPVKTDAKTLAAVYDMARENPEDFKKMRLSTLVERIAVNDLERVQSLQRDMNKPDREKDVATTTQLMGVYTAGWKPERRAPFEAAVYDELNSFEKSKGKPASYEEKKKIMGRMIVDGEVLSGSWFKNDPNKRYYEATPEERKRFAPTISSEDRALITSALKAEGIAAPTEKQIVDRFKLAKGMQ